MFLIIQFLTTEALGKNTLADGRISPLEVFLYSYINFHKYVSISGVVLQSNGQEQLELCLINNFPQINKLVPQAFL